jgi:hypothetical protein
MAFLAIAAIFKNEAPYLKEWMDYHLLVGVEHFYLYDNGSTDQPRDVLAPYMRRGEVTLIQWPDREKESWQERKWGWVFTTQVAAYEHAFLLARGHREWIAAIDIDEFLVPMQVDSLREVLELYAPYPGIEVSWQIFGTSGHVKAPPSIIQHLTRKSLNIAALNRQCKSIVRPECYQQFLFPPHLCQYADGRIPYPIDKGQLVLNHYFNRSEEDFFQKLASRQGGGAFSKAEIEILLHLGNDEEDDLKGIRRFIFK